MNSNDYRFENKYNSIVNTMHNGTYKCVTYPSHWYQNSRPAQWQAISKRKQSCNLTQSMKK